MKEQTLKSLLKMAYLMGCIDGGDEFYNSMTTGMKKNIKGADAVVREVLGEAAMLKLKQIQNEKNTNTSGTTDTV